MSIKHYTAYMEKEAEGGLFNFSTMSEAGSQILEKLPYLLLLPAAAGAAGGYVASKMSSPTDTDTAKIQNEFLKEKLKTYVARRQRESDIAKMNAKHQTDSNKPRDLML
jgi:hypothetical protein